MIKFIICEDNKKISNNVEHVITKTMINSNDDYQVTCFSDCTKELNNVIKEKGSYKIYILDIELPNGSGIDISRKIREKDWSSQIIFLTSHSELKSEAFYCRFLILSFISKFNDYKTELYKSINTALQIRNHRQSLTFISNYVTYRITLDDIVYILKDTSKRKTNIITHEKTYETSLTIAELEDKLDSRFFKTHQSAIANISNIKNIDYSNEVITFNNNMTLDYISKDKKKELKEYVERYN